MWRMREGKRSLRWPLWTSHQHFYSATVTWQRQNDSSVFNANNPTIFSANMFTVSNDLLIMITCFDCRKYMTNLFVYSDNILYLIFWICRYSDNIQPPESNFLIEWKPIDKNAFSILLEWINSIRSMVVYNKIMFEPFYWDSNNRNSLDQMKTSSKSQSFLIDINESNWIHTNGYEIVLMNRLVSSGYRRCNHIHTHKCAPIEFPQQADPLFGIFLSDWAALWSGIIIQLHASAVAALHLNLIMEAGWCCLMLTDSDSGWLTNLRWTDKTNAMRCLLVLQMYTVTTTTTTTTMFMNVRHGSRVLSACLMLHTHRQTQSNVRHQTYRRLNLGSDLIRQMSSGWRMPYR